MYFELNCIVDLYVTLKHILLYVHVATEYIFLDLGNLSLHLNNGSSLTNLR